MNIGFPSRFLKKLDIYQQIRSGQGISKHKEMLWKYERAFLQTAYGRQHQHLNSFSDKNQVIEWIQEVFPKYNREDYEHIIGNLFYKGYLEARDKEKDIPSDLVTRNHQGISNHVFAQRFEYRATQEGLLVGEVAVEIYNKNPLLRYWNRYKYELIVDTVWLLVFAGVYRLLFPAGGINTFLGFNIGQFEVTPNVAKIAIIFALWPLLNLLYRYFYLAFEHLFDGK